MIEISTAVVIGFLSAVYLFLLKRPKRKNNEPPLSCPIPFLGQGIAFTNNYAGLIQSLRTKHGSIFTMINFGQRMHFITDIRSTKKIWSLPKLFNFADFASNAEANFGGIETKEEIDASGVAASTLAIHAKLMSRPEELEKLATRFKSALDEAIQNIPMLRCEEWHTLNLKEFSGTLVWYAAGRSLYGTGWLKGKHGEERVNIAESYRKYAEFEDAAPMIVGGLPRFLTHKGCLARDYLRDILMPVLDDGCTGGHPYIQNYVKQLKQAYKGKEDSLLKISARMIGLMFAINSNTMMLLFWTIARVFTVPKENRDRLLEEISTAMKKYSTWADIKKHTPMLTSFIIETLRFHSDPNSFRMVGEDFIVQGLGENGDKTFAFRKGDSVFMLSSFDQLKGVDGDNQNQFDGERWLEYTSDPKLSNSLFPIPASKILVPFGGGKHLCPGRFFATIEMHYVIAFCFQNYEFEFVDATAKLPRKVVELSAPINQPKDEVMVRVRYKGKVIND